MASCRRGHELPEGVDVADCPVCATEQTQWRRPGSGSDPKQRAERVLVPPDVAPKRRSAEEPAPPPPPPPPPELVREAFLGSVGLDAPPVQEPDPYDNGPVHGRGPAGYEHEPNGDRHFIPPSIMERSGDRSIDGMLEVFVAPPEAPLPERSHGSALDLLAQPFALVALGLVLLAASSAFFIAESVDMSTASIPGSGAREIATILGTEAILVIAAGVGWLAWRFGRRD
ncbi:MAG TPA: hypothetical protein VGS21_07295 [Acidimicrobiales bacterium]|nr:hypothetical protein [Acidimicrobiales bacterium]